MANEVHKYVWEITKLHLQVINSKGLAIKCNVCANVCVRMCLLVCLCIVGALWLSVGATVIVETITTTVGAGLTSAVKCARGDWRDQLRFNYASNCVLLNTNENWPLKLLVQYCCSYVCTLHAWRAQCTRTHTYVCMTVFVGSPCSFVLSFDSVALSLPYSFSFRVSMSLGECVSCQAKIVIVI